MPNAVKTKKAHGKNQNTKRPLAKNQGCGWVVPRTLTTTGFHHTHVRVTLYLTDEKHVIIRRFVWRSAELTILFIGCSYRNVYAERNPTTACDREVTSAIDPELHCKREPRKQRNSPTVSVARNNYEGRVASIIGNMQR